MFGYSIFHGQFLNDFQYSLILGVAIFGALFCGYLVNKDKKEGD